MKYCSSIWNYSRRLSREVVIGDLAKGGVVVGGAHPVVRQSMLTCDTMDTGECVRQTLELAAVGTAGDLSDAAFAGPAHDFYFTNPIARASVTMAECSATAKAARVKPVAAE